MSYILEALKKAEKERKNEGVPDLQADHSIPSPRKPERKLSATWPAGVVVLLFLGAGGWFWWQEKSELPHPAAEQQLVPPLALPPSHPRIAEAPVPEEPAPAAVEPKEETSLEPFFQEVPQLVAEVKEGNTLSAGGVAGNPSGPQEKDLKGVEELIAGRDAPEPLGLPPLLEELPLELRKNIPELSFAGHVYADDAEKRLIIINNRIVREGDLVDSGLFLQQITRDGVIVRYETVLFRVKLF